MITGNKRETCSRWLFDYAEPPYNCTYGQLAEDYENNLHYLKGSESESTWSVDELICTPDEIQDLVEARLRFLETGEQY